MSKTVVLYHASCADGFGAAWAAWKKLGRSAKYIPVQYGSPPPEEANRAEKLFILDFSYPYEQLTFLAQTAMEIIIIDHHKTAESDLLRFANEGFGNGPIDNCGVLFDPNRSGAVLTFRCFFGEEETPLLLKYVQDRDLWKWELEKSREINALIASHRFNFVEWNALSERLDGGYWGGMVKEGEAILRFQSQQIERHVKKAYLRDVSGSKVPVVNATVLISEIGEALCEKFSDSPFSATYFVKEDGSKVWSLRSKNGFDVGELAKELGGGGHPAAAGFVETYRGF